MNDVHDEGANCSTEQFESLRSAWIDLRKTQATHEQNTAPRFNVFRMLGVERAETRLHSPLLCDLLDPYGSHGQGSLFLQSFFELLAHRAQLQEDRSQFLTLAKRIGLRPEPGEWIVLSEREKIDLSIRSGRHKIILFVENKIDASEQERQLERYEARLENLKGSYPFGRLILFSPEGYEPRTGKPDLHLVYQRDIASWLDRVRTRCNLPVRLAGTLLQYTATAKNLGGTSNVPDDDFTSILSKPENLGCGLEIARRMPKVEWRLRMNFWERIATELKKSLDNNELSGRWEIRWTEMLDSDKRLGSSEWLRGKGYQGVYLDWDGDKRLDMQTGVLVSWKNSELVVWYGVYGYNFPHTINELDALAEKGFDVWNNIDPEDKGYGHWGICKYRTDLMVKHDAFLMRMASESGDTAAGLVQDVVQMLNTNSESLASIRRRLAHAPESAGNQI